MSAATQPATPVPLKPVFKNVPFSARIPRNVRVMLEQLVPVFQQEAKDRGEDWEEIDLSHVAAELLATQAVREWAERGIREAPKSEDAWTAAVKNLVRDRDIFALHLQKLAEAKAAKK